MSLEESILEAVRALPADKQQEVLDFADFLKIKSRPVRPRKSLEGLWAGRAISISEEDIAEARREMFGNFPRRDT
ncbi:MAG: DUF2281 domain-containing protein [Acidobacteria bacterium]|nr:DUF2281 domain-containing protein [Acidobacteriota bacterium]MBI3473903.1 DUF2281 domain-containing protein [Candidatus Solibacter usitatus]